MQAEKSSANEATSDLASKRGTQLESEMRAPSAKRMCSTVVNAVRRIAVEGNIGGW